MKEIGIQKQTTEIVQQAKANTRKIEDYKAKLRQSAMGGLITNDLKNKVDKLRLLEAKKEVEPSEVDEKEGD